MKLDFAEYQNNDAHGQDSVRTHQCDNALLVAIADGISGSEEAKKASQATVDAAVDAFKLCYRFSEAGDPFTAFNDFFRTFEEFVREGLTKEKGDAKTTGTLIVFEEMNRNRSNQIVAKYCAYGDSPIYVAYPQVITDDYPGSFLFLQVHGKPLVTQGAKVYSFVDVGNREIVGRREVGTFNLEEDDICIVMTDGIPARDYIYRDIGKPEGNHRFLNAVRNEGGNAAVALLGQWIKEEDALSDDATLVVVTLNNKSIPVSAA